MTGATLSLFCFGLRNEEGEEQLHLRRLQLPFNFATGEALLYDINPTVAPPDSCSAPKQRKLDSYSVSPQSMLGCMLNQDQSIYCEHNNTNTLNSIDDVAFKDTHATVSVPGDIWPDASPTHVTGSLLKSESTIQDMMDTLQQILGENDLTDALDVEPDELKSWESTLLKMSSSCELSEDLNSILSDDILSYVEEQLQREGGLKLPDQLDEIPPCLSMLDLRNQNPDQEQNFGWPLDAQNQPIPKGGQMMSRQGPPGQGMMKLTHMDLPMSSSGLNGPTLQQITSQQMLPASGGLQLGATGNIGAPVTYNSSLLDSWAPTQNQGRTLQAEDNNLQGFPLTQPSANQIQSNQTAPPMQNHLQGMTSNLPGGLQDQSPGPVFNFQGSQWGSHLNPADCFVDSYTQNISKEPGFPADPLPSSCLQGHFALQTQNNELQRQPWPLEPPQISGGHQQTASCVNQMSGFQRNPPLGMVAVQNAVQAGFRTSETLNVSFPVQQNAVPPPSSACMFDSAAATTPPCQRLNSTGNQIPSKPSCIYQSPPKGGAVLGMTAVPNPDEAALSCNTATGLNPGDLLIHQQQYLNFRKVHTQVRTRK